MQLKGTLMRQSTQAMVKEHLAASRKVRKRYLRSRKAARDFLVAAGILTKDGKRLAKPYR